MNGFSRFDPFVPVHPFDDRFQGGNEIDKITERINKAISEIREWQTIMNIFGCRGWVDPLTEDIHIVITKKRLLTVGHIADAAEKEIYEEK